MEYLASDRIAIIDLASGEVNEEPYPDELCQEKIGGAGVNLALYQQHQDGEPIVLGAGLFTGSMVPGSDLGVVTAKSPLTGAVCHAPLTQYAGMELKYSGFDYIVLKGAAASPKYLWVHDGIADLEDASDLWGQDVWAACEAVRANMGDELIQVLGAGPAAEQGSDLAALMINYWPSGDRFGLGRALATKNLKLIALRGLGLLEIAEPEDFAAQCLELLGAVKGGAWAGKKGLADLAAGLGQQALADWLAPLVHRHRASFNTPFAANTFLFLEADPSQLSEPPAPEPGVLVGDLAALAGLQGLGLSAAEAGQVLGQCAHLGLDPAGVAAAAAAAGVKDAAGLMAGLATIKGPVPGLSGPLAPAAPAGALFGLAQSADPAWRARRQALAYLFGLDPLFMLMAPELSEEKLLELVGLGIGLEIGPEALDAAVAGIG